MKKFYKIITRLNLAIYFLLIVAPFGLHLPVNQLFAQTPLQYENSLEWANAIASSSRQDSQKQEGQNQSVQFIEKCFRQIAADSISRQVDGYHRNNNLEFNLPFICYKFPRAEHREAG